MPTRSRRPVAAALLLVLTVIVTGCTGAPGVDGPAPQTRDEFYAQELVWHSCDIVLECATVRAPLDWDDPARDAIRLAVVRIPALGEPTGSLLINPGGPGVSGFDAVASGRFFPPPSRIRQSFDLVGFDPRGVNRSSAVTCSESTEELDRFRAAPAESAERFAERCAELTGPLLEFVDTVSAARDLDLLRALLGDERLSYIGYSYGTLLGATYAELFPQNVGRLVLDSAVDPTLTGLQFAQGQLAGGEASFRRYLHGCAERASCPVADDGDAALARVTGLLAELNAHPLDTVDGRALNGDLLAFGLHAALYERSNWPHADAALAGALAGDPEPAMMLVDGATARDATGFRTNYVEAGIAINCLDYAWPADAATLADEIERFEAASPSFGAFVDYPGTVCVHWAHPARRPAAPTVAAGSAPILVIGGLHDPATPYAWSESLAAQLENAVLLTVDADGHVAADGGNFCATRAAENYLLDGTLPAPGTVC